MLNEVPKYFKRHFDFTPDSSMIRSEDPPGEWISFEVNDSAWIGKPSSAGGFDAVFLSSYWKGDFDSEPMWETYETDGKKFWVFTTCNAWSHTRYEEQSASKEFTRHYWLAGENPQPWYDCTEYSENSEVWISDSVPQRFGATTKISFKGNEVIEYSIYWNENATVDQPGWKGKIVENTWRRKNGFWEEVKRKETENPALKKSDAMKVFRKGEMEICEWWFEGGW